jgi:hypothetical protein
MRSPKFLPGYLTAAERPKWSWRFLGMIVEFAYLHEVAHAMRGHFAYLGGRAARGSSFCLDEQARRHGRYVELDADLHALEMWMDTTREAEDFPTTPTLLEELYFQRLFSAILLYQSLDQGGLSAREHERLGHPAPIHRSMLLSRAMFSSGRTYFGLTAERLREVHSQAQSEASVAARCWRLTKDRWWGGRDGLRREPEKYARQLHYYLTKVEPRIDALNATLPDTLV